MLEAYKNLLEHCDLLKLSMVEKLEIDKGNVIVNIKTKDSNISMFMMKVHSFETIEEIYGKLKKISNQYN